MYMEAQASLFRMSEHKLIAPKLEQMKSELVKYNTIVKAIKPLEQRLKDGKDTFSLLEFWRANEGEVPAFAYVVCCALSSRTHLTLFRRSASSPSSTTPLRMTWTAPWQTTSGSRCSCSSTSARALRHLCEAL